MTYLNKFIYNPGGENEAGSAGSNNAEEPKENVADTAGGITEEKPIIEKIKEALQDWSNKDEADQEFDDTRV
ncbi:MAG: hypothetical protein ABIQ31_11005 [Ferruginibacter sp.]